MKQLIFYSDTGFPFSILAAAIKSGQLPRARCPRREELAAVLDTCGTGRGDARVYSFGDSPEGEKCLALWTRGNGDMVKRAIASFLGLYGRENYQLITIRHKKTPAITAGSWLARVPLLRQTGLRLLHRGLQGMYPALVESACPENNARGPW